MRPTRLYEKKPRKSRIKKRRAIEQQHPSSLSGLMNGSSDRKVQLHR